jgi:hypothetical protein
MYRPRWGVGRIARERSEAGFVVDIVPVTPVSKDRQDERSDHDKQNEDRARNESRLRFLLDPWPLAPSTPSKSE